MGEIGWAFIGGKAAGGSKGAVQYNDGETWITGSDNFKYVQETNTVVVSSSVFVSGTLYANDYQVNVVNQTVTNLNSEGSSKFGDTNDDLHQFTGSVSVNGNFEIVGNTAMFSSSVDSDLIFEDGGSFYSSSNNNVPANAAFVRAENPAMIVSGTAVFNDAVSFQGGLYGASPIQIFAPLSFQDAAAGKESTFEAGKITGDLEIHTTDVDSGFTVTGPGGIVIKTGVATPLLRAVSLYDTTVETHPNMSQRKSNELSSFLNQVQTKVPILVGDDANNLNDYILEDISSTRVVSKTDLRKNSYSLSFQVPHTEFDDQYEALESSDDPALLDAATTLPFTTNDYDNLSETIAVMDVGTFGNVGESNKYGVRRGAKLAGNLVPSAIDRDALGKTGTPYPNFETKDLTIGNPTARWGDLYLSNDRKITWGENVSGSDWFNNSQENNSASFGYENTFNSLVVDGARLKVKNNLSINSAGYINFGDINNEDGYGFRDLNGILQFKNETGGWESFHDSFDSVGVNGSIQLSNGNGGYVSSNKLTFNNDTLTVDGTIVTNELRVNTIDQTITNISMTGSTTFGDTSDDSHDFIGSMSVSGSLSLKRKVITDNYILEATDHFIGVDSAVNVTIELPLASELNDGQFFTIKDENGEENKQIILQCSGSDEIDGQQSISLTSPYTAINLYTNGQNKFFVF